MTAASVSSAVFADLSIYGVLDAPRRFGLEIADTRLPYPDPFIQLFHALQRDRGRVTQDFQRVLQFVCEQGQLPIRRLARQQVDAKKPVSAAHMNVVIKTCGQSGQGTAPRGDDVNQPRQSIDAVHHLSKGRGFRSAAANQRAELGILGSHVRTAQGALGD
jgi:hypothetical protein